MYEGRGGTTPEVGCYNQAAKNALLTDFGAVLLPFIASRLLFLLVTLAVSWGLDVFHLKHLAPATLAGGLWGFWYRWDSVWYLRIATDGYRLQPYLHHHQNLAFFPLYPLLLHIWLQWWPWSRVAAAMVIANLCALGATLFLFRLVRHERGALHAQRVVWLFTLFPTSLFLFAGYSESLFLLCLILGFYHARSEHWWRAGLCGGLAAATRSLGVIALVPFLVYWYQAQRARTEYAPARPALLFDAWRMRAYSLAATTFIPGGLLTFAAYLGVRFGNPLAFSSSQRSWHRTWEWPWHTLAVAIMRMQEHLFPFSNDALHACSDILWTAVFLTLTVLATRQLSRPYALFLWLFWAVVLSTPESLDGTADVLMSLPRFVLTAFPLLIYLAGTSRRTRIVCAISLPLLIVNTAIFTGGGWVA
jgi:hypothetical protein